MALKVTDTLRGEKVEFQPLEEGKVRMYVCGLTPYDRMHLGHVRTYVAYDVIRRYLEHRGYDVTHVQNITDVEDKLIARANEVGEDPIALAARFHDEALEDLATLRVLPAHHYPKVSGHIDGIIRMTERLIERGHAYVGEAEEGVDGARSVYFDVSSDDDYGKLSRTDPDDLREGVRKEVAAGKRDAVDFALWKAAKPGEPMWDSPWGKGRPGWHIECSVMSTELLGDALDIHGGGRDLVFPHHENEIAQTESATGETPFVRHWLHTGFLTVEGEKMSKSLGNFATARDALEDWDPVVLRLWLVGTHYRSPIDFSEASLHQAQANLERVRNMLAGAAHALEAARVGEATEADEAFAEAADAARRRFRDAMDDDFNTPAALATLFELVAAINKYAAGDPHRDALEAAVATFRELAGNVFAILPGGDGGPKAAEAAPFIDLLLEVRQQARERKAWDIADTVRDRLAELGVVVEDTDSGPRWRFE